MKAVPIIIFVLFLFNAEGFPINTGDKAPYFRVMDGNNSSMDLNTIKGRVVIGFYEDRDAVNKNQRLKDELKNFYVGMNNKLNKNIFKLAIVDATPANALTKWIWKKKIQKKSEETGITIYGDWDGEMKKAYGLSDSESTFLVIDDRGDLRYIKSGKIDSEEFKIIFTLIKKILSDEKP